MPSAVANNDSRVRPVIDFAAVLDELLARAGEAKPSPAIEPALQKSDFGDINESLSAIFPEESAETNGAEASKPSAAKIQQYAVTETAIRNLFTSLIAHTSIDDPEFVRVWNLLDLISILSDAEQCDAALLVWLVEELLDGQTIAGCRTVFDYLESRRDRITAKHFNAKKLVVLRTCNELLRRLSRAEDTAFCGRVYIFMFQCFDLGDRSSVNLRGEYHVENVTIYDRTVSGAVEGAEPAEKMDVDAKVPMSKAVSFESTKNGEKTTLKPDELYPIFWSLQDSFSQPKKLFDADSLTSFRLGLDATLTAFNAVQQEQGSRQSKATDVGDGSSKRKRDDQAEGSLANNFNPKYLTSRDLFELEIGDLSFRRHILVQAFIIVEFLLSLSASAKEKHESLGAPNKSVLYPGQVLSQEDAAWVTKMKRDVEDCLKQDTDGPQFHRMIETALARDKNWARWKAESCPSIALPPVSAESFVEAQEEMRRMTGQKRARKLPLGSVSLDFMKTNTEEEEMDKFRDPERYKLPELDSFQKKIANDDWEIEMPDSEESKAAAVESKASKTWQALRVASRSRIGLFDKIGDTDKIDAVFGEVEDPDAGISAEEEAIAKDNAPTDQRPIVLVGVSGVGKSTISNLLTERRAGAFKQVARHTTLKPKENESLSSDLTSIEKQAFDMLRDGDALLEYTTAGEADYGTNRRAIEAVADSGKVPLVHLEPETVQQVRDNGFDARFILVTPPSKDTLEERLAKAGKSEEERAAALSAALPYLDDADTGAKDGFDLVLVFDELEDAYRKLETFIYGNEEDVKMGDAEEKTNESAPNGDADPTPAPEQSAKPEEGTTTDVDAEMADAAPSAGPDVEIQQKQQEGEEEQKQADVQKGTVEGVAESVVQAPTKEG